MNVYHKLINPSETNNQIPLDIKEMIIHMTVSLCLDYHMNLKNNK